MSAIRRAHPAPTLPEAMDSPHAGQDTGDTYNWGLILALVGDLAFWVVLAYVVSLLV